jgi:hypothetical protein
MADCGPVVVDVSSLMLTGYPPLDYQGVEIAVCRLQSARIQQRRAQAG